MSKFKVQMDDNLDLRITHISTPVTYEDIVEFMAREREKAQRLNLIWNFASGSLQLLSTEELKSLLIGGIDHARK